MDGIEDRSRKDARTVEITVALVLGALVMTLPAVAAVTVWWLVRSERERPE